MPYVPSNLYDKLSTLNCEEVAARLGLDVRNHKCCCFIHDDRHPSLSFFGKDRRAWNCFVCRRGGNSINLVMDYYGIDRVEACRWLCREFNIPFDGKPQSANKVYRPKSYFVKSSKDNSDDEKQFDREIAQFILNKSVLTEEGFDFLFKKRMLKKEVVENLGIVSLSNSNNLLEFLISSFPIDRLVGSGFVKITNGIPYLRLWTPCLLFPYRNVEGEIIGIQSRYLGNVDNAPRFLFISKSKTHLFNLPILNRLKYDDDLYISEGITDCLALLSTGRNAIAVPSATLLPVDEIIALRRYQLHMFPDNDKAGQTAFTNLQNILIQYGSFLLREQLPDGVKDFSDYYVNSVSSI